MKTCRIPFSSVAGFLILLGTMSIPNRAAACPLSFSGSGTFTAVPGGSQSQTWTVTDAVPSNGQATINILSGSDVFTLDHSQITFSNGVATFTITFRPSENAIGTFTGTMKCDQCDYIFDLVGTIPMSGVANALPSNVSFTFSPNPATDNVNFATSGVRSAEITIYDLLGKQIASSNTTTWKWDASGIATGSYIARIAGESNSGEHFAICRRIFIAR